MDTKTIYSKLIHIQELNQLYNKMRDINKTIDEKHSEEITHKLDEAIASEKTKLTTKTYAQRSSTKGSSSSGSIGLNKSGIGGKKKIGDDKYPIANVDGNKDDELEYIQEMLSDPNSDIDNDTEDIMYLKNTSKIEFPITETKPRKVRKLNNNSNVIS